MASPCRTAPACLTFQEIVRLRLEMNQEPPAAKPAAPAPLRHGWEPGRTDAPQNVYRRHNHWQARVCLGSFRLRIEAVRAARKATLAVGCACTVNLQRHDGTHALDRWQLRAHLGFFALRTDALKAVRKARWSWHAVNRA